MATRAESSPTTARSGAPRPWFAWAGAVIVVALLVAFPPFHVSSRREARQPGETSVSAFVPAAFATEFWRDRLLPAAARAPELGPLLSDLRRDPAAALARHGHRVGLGHAAYYFVRGSGRVTAVERSRILVEIDGAIVAIRTGPIFGNVVRDGCGLLEVNQVPGLTEFNALSAELNRLVEENVLPALKGRAAVGNKLTFAGCAEAPESLPAAGAPVLTFIAVEATLTP